MNNLYSGIPGQKYKLTMQTVEKNNYKKEYNEQVQFSSVQDGIYALGKAHMRSQKFPQLCLWNGSNVRLIDDGFLSSFQGRSSNATSFYACLLQVLCTHTTTLKIKGK